MSLVNRDSLSLPNGFFYVLVLYGSLVSIENQTVKVVNRMLAQPTVLWIDQISPLIKSRRSHAPLDAFNKRNIFGLQCFIDKFNRFSLCIVGRVGFKKEIKDFIGLFGANGV